jgi:hypothetical protein
LSETTALAVRAPMDLTDKIKEMQKQKFNILLPMTTFASQNELFVPRLDIVEPDLKSDFYKQGIKKVGDEWEDILAPSGQFLNKVASAANIQWHPDKCGHTVLEKNRVVYKAVAAVRQADGQWRTITDEYELDLEVIEEELRIEYKKKAKTEAFQKKMKKDDMEVEDYITRDLLQKRRHKLALAATGAMNRVIRKALTLRSTYSPNEAKQPFAIARFDFQPDYNDPTVRRFASIAAIQAQNDLYGQGSAALPSDTSQEEVRQAEDFMNTSPTDIDFNTGEIINAEVIETESQGPEEPEMPEAEDPLICQQCGKEIQGFKDNKGKEWQAEEFSNYTLENFSQRMCKDCLLIVLKATQEEKKKGADKGKK